MKKRDDWVNLVAKLSKKLEESHDADVGVYCGPFRPPHDERFIQTVKTKSRHNNFLLFVTTYGGSAHVAYRMARCLQRQYSKGKIELYIDRECASAGTLFAFCATSLIMADEAQLGPLDVQLRKLDEVGERSSGLTPMQALNALQSSSWELFKSSFLKLRYDDELGMATKMASQISSELTVGMFRAIYEQIDPMRLGELDRFVKIALEYGKRLQKSNLKDGALEKLIAAYPSHEFVIDREEAENLFNSVRAPIAEEEELAQELREVAKNANFNEMPFHMYLSDLPVEPEGKEEASHEPAVEQNRSDPKSEESGVSQDLRKDGKGKPVDGIARPVGTKG